MNITKHEAFLIKLLELNQIHRKNKEAIRDAAYDEIIRAKEKYRSKMEKCLKDHIIMLYEYYIDSNEEMTMEMLEKLYSFEVLIHYHGIKI